MAPHKNVLDEGNPAIAALLALIVCIAFWVGVLKLVLYLV